MDSFQLARYIEQTDSISKPWLLLQLQLKKLQERKAMMEPHEYMRELSELHEAMMRLGEWWKGIEEEAFNPDFDGGHSGNA